MLMILLEGLLHGLLREFLPQIIEKLDGAFGFPRMGVDLVLDFSICGGEIWLKEFVNKRDGGVDLLVAVDGDFRLKLERR